jgi:WD40 repeat protein/energy-coupling factor transporter ATP-binding protein EcfA2
MNGSMTKMEPIVPEPTPYQMDELPKFPYPGLRPFKASEAAIFYGRNTQKDAVLERLNESRMVFITGPSGCGKSSLIKAGVIPALRAGLLSKVGYRWKTAEMRPGRRPLINLLRAIEDAFGPDSSGGRPSRSELRSYLEHDEAGLWDAMSMMADRAENPRDAGGHPLLLLIDQFEEIFGQQIKDSFEVDKFVRLLVTQYARPHPSLFIAFTIRSDYVGLCASFPGLSDAINHCQYLTPVLTPVELREAIVRPAEDYKTHVSDSLVREILADMHSGTAYDADNLPLMQHALLWLWQKASASSSPGTSGPNATPTVTLNADEYRKFGRLRGILGQHADAILRDAAGANDERGAIVEALFRRLAERDSNGRYRRSPAAFDEVKEIASCTEAELKQVIDPFADEKASFLEIRKSERADEYLLDVSHEALIRTWDQARAWTNLEAEKVQTFRELLRSAEAWRDDQENPGRLKRLPELGVFEQWWRQSAPTVRWAKRYYQPNGRGAEAVAAVDLLTRYLDASIDAELREKRERAKMRAERFRLKLIAAGSFVVAGFVALGLFSWMKWTEAGQAEAEVLAQRAKTIALRAEDALEYEGPAKALLFAMEAQNQGLPDLLETEQVIFKSLKQPLEKRIISEVSILGGMGVAYSPDGKAIVAMESNSLRFWNPSDGEEIDRYPLDALQLATPYGKIQWSPTGEWLAIGAQDKILLLAPCSHPRLKTLFPSCAEEGEDRQKVMLDPDHRAGLAKFSNDGRWMVIGGFGATLRRWEIANGDATAEKGTSLNVTVSSPNAFAISPDMTKLAAGWQGSRGAGEIGIFDPDSGEPQAILRPPEDQKDHGSVIALSFNPSDSNMLVASETGGKIFVWDVKHNIAERLTGTKGTAYQVAFSRDGKSIAAASDDGVIRTWKTQELTNEPNELRGHRGPVYWVSFSPDGSLASACPTDKTIRIWNQHSPLGEDPRPAVSRSIGAPDSEERLPRDFGPIAASATSETGRRVVANAEGRLALFAKGWRAPIVDWQGPADVTSLTLEHDPDRIVTVSSSGKLKSWPFFRDVSALISFARDHIPFNGEGRLTLADKDRCKIALPDDSACKPKSELIQ